MPTGTPVGLSDRGHFINRGFFFPCDPSLYQADEKIQHTENEGIYFWVVWSINLNVCLFLYWYCAGFVTVAPLLNMKTDVVIPVALLFLFKIGFVFCLLVL